MNRLRTQFTGKFGHDGVVLLNEVYGGSLQFVGTVYYDQPAYIPGAGNFALSVGVGVFAKPIPLNELVKQQFRIAQGNFSALEPGHVTVYAPCVVVCTDSLELVPING